MLLDFFLSVKDELKLKLTAAHFEHGIRGEASKEDAAFVEKFCEQKGVDFALDSFDVPSFAKEKHLSLEAAARELRYGFLRRVAKKRGALIATAHHADDQAETVLMRILRGTGVEGLAAMRPRQGDIIRPFLSLTKDEILALCESEGLKPRNDETNEDVNYFRNRVRLKLLPELEAYNPQIKSALCRLAKSAAEQSDYLKEEVKALCEERVSFEKKRAVISCSDTEKLSPVLQREIIKKALAAFSLENIAFEHWDNLFALFETKKTGKRVELPGKVTAERLYDKLVLFRSDEERIFREERLNVPGETIIDRTKIKVTARSVSNFNVYTDKKRFIFDADKLTPPFCIRTRRDGDVICLKEGHKKLKKLLQDKKIAGSERGKLLLLCDAKEILAVVGVRSSVAANVDENTKSFLEFTVEGEW